MKRCAPCCGEFVYNCNTITPLCDTERVVLIPQMSLISVLVRMSCCVAHVFLNVFNLCFI